MKKKNKIIIWSIMLCLAISLIGAGVLLLLKRNTQEKEAVTESKVIAVEWYDEAQTEFVISTSKEMYEFMKLAEFYDFSGQTIKLGADIVLNEGNAEDWAEKAPKNIWYTMEGFNGTFDGQGHTVSGLYVVGRDGSAGMFTDTGSECVIQNFRLINSYITSYSNAGTGSIVGYGAPVIDTVYSNAIVYGTRCNVGGIIGKTVGGTECLITNCWFDGSVNTETEHGYYAGGIVGYGSTLVRMEHCLNTGDVYVNRGRAGMYAGGLAGCMGSGVVHKITDCLSLGTVGASGTTYVGNVFGRLLGGADIYFTNSYGSLESYSGRSVGSVYSSSATYGICALINEAKLVGVGGYRWTNLDFENYWTIVEGGTPVLQAFAETTMEVPDGTTKIFSLDWYDTSVSEYTLYTKEDLYGWYLLSASNNFTDKTIKLGADIIFNTGNASDWGEKAPTSEWSPIIKFNGTFDGQGHTISGLYVWSDVRYVGLFGATSKDTIVQNLSIKNSYFECQISSGTNGMIGSVAGLGRGIYKNIYSDAIIVSDGQVAGGIVGHLISAPTSEFNNCWFDGTVSLKGKNGRYGGGILGMAKSDTTISHCLVTGTVTSDKPSAGIYLGGVCGFFTNNYTFTIEDTLVAGSVVPTGGTTYCGPVHGRLNLESTLNVKGLYVTTESSTSKIGTISSPAVMNGGVIRQPEEFYYGDNGYIWTNLDFENYWSVVEGSTPVLKSFVSNPSGTPTAKRKVSFDWYNPSKKTHTITKMEELYGFALMLTTKSYANETIKLGNDIVFNIGDASTWGTTAPENQWIVTSSSFNGTFDGQGNSIEGLYVKSTTKYVGLFGQTLNAARIENLSITNSYYECDLASSTVAYMGSFAGVGRGIFKNLYSDAILVSNGERCGGIVGQVSDASTSEFNNCWYAGTVSLTGDNGRYAGGIVGNLQSSTSILHCLFTGTVTTDKPSAGIYIGGLCGYKTGSKTLNIEDTLIAGSVVPTGGKTYVGAVLGRADKGIINVKDLYETSESYTSRIGTVSSPAVFNGAVIRKSEESYYGYDGYIWTSLDFEDYWAVVDGDTPVLKRFASKVPSLAGKTQMVDLSWYDATEDEMVIDSVQDLYGFQLLSQSITFSGKTIRLGADLVVNEGDAADWANTAPSLSWTPIGTTNYVFAGTFDGADAKGVVHSISGLYTKTSTQFVGLFAQTENSAEIKNLKLLNSYFEYTGNSHAMMGSIVGRSKCNITNVYSDAIVKSSRAYFGGLIGQIPNFDATKTVSIADCWFDGSVTLIGSNARYSGGIAGDVRNNTKMKNCLNTATITTNNSTNEPCIGGLVGEVTMPSTDSSLKLEILDCMNTGTVQTTGSKKTYLGSLIGYVYERASVEIGNTYATTESNSKTIGYVGETSSTLGDAILLSEDDMEGYGGYEWTNLDFDDHWAVDEEGTPVLKNFASSVPSVETRTRKMDITWYNELDTEVTTHTIDSAADLRGFSILGKNRDFSGQTIVLAEDITLNTGSPLGADGAADAADEENPDDWQYVAPAESWTPIGSYVAGNRFNGTFSGLDTKTGEIHSISGLYTKSTSQYQGLFAALGADAKVENLKLINSYFEYTGTKEAMMGSIVGRTYGGDLKKVYSDAIVRSSGSYFGGLIGQVTNSTTITVDVEDCWFDGSVTQTTTSTQYVGGLVGDVRAETNIKHCLNTGAVTGYQYVGGLVGMAIRPGSSKDYVELTIEDSLNTGTISATKNPGLLLGGAGRYSGITMNSAYAAIQGTVDASGFYNGTAVLRSAAENPVDADNLKGELALTHASKLSFEDKGDGIHWVAGASATAFPTLKCFQTDTTPNNNVSLLTFVLTKLASLIR